MKKILSILTVAFVALMATSCDKYLDVNKNLDAPDENSVPAYLYLAGVEGYYTAQYWDGRGLMPLVQYMGTSGNGSTYGTSHTYIAASDYMGEIWKMTYWTQGKNLENIISKAIEAEQWHLAGVGLAMKANSWDMLTKEYGEAPLYQAYEPGRLAFDYDSQEEIMTKVREWAYQAIEYLEMEDKTNYSNTVNPNDVIYGGDFSKWKKFAYGVIVRNLSALVNKSDFASTYAPELISAAANALATADDDAAVQVGGGGPDAPSSGYNNFYGTQRGNLANSYWQHDYITAILSGTVVEYTAGNDTREEETVNLRYKYKVSPTQFVADTTKATGTYDPRLAAKLATYDDPEFNDINDRDAVMNRYYLGGRFSGRTGFNVGEAIDIDAAPNVWGTNAAVNVANSGNGRWLFRNDAPYILMTASEIQFCLAEAYFRTGNKSAALEAFKKAVALDMDFTEKYLTPGTKGDKNGGGDKISKALFRTLANEYLSGPYVGGLTTGTLTLSHIMMQKYVALFPWGALETWVDQRKVWYDIDFTGDYPSKGNGWSNTRVNPKYDDNPTKVYRGYYFVSSDKIDTRGNSLSTRNEGAPSFRIRPRYNSEYMWNKKSLEGLKPISGTDDKYSCSPMWFQYPGDAPESLNY